MDLLIYEEEEEVALWKTMHTSHNAVIIIITIAVFDISVSCLTPDGDTFQLFHTSQ